MPNIMKFGGGANKPLKAIFVGTSYAHPRGRLINDDGTTSELTTVGQTVSCDYFSISMGSSGYVTITRTTNDSTKVYVFNVKQRSSDYIFKELTNDDPTYTQVEAMDGSYAVVAF